MTADERKLLLDYRDIHRSFGAVQALRGASLQVEEGSVHGLVGHNGAGKSTLVRIVSGFVAAERGSMRFADEAVVSEGRRDAIARGVWTVPQELTVLPDMSVSDNISIGGEPRSGPFLKNREQKRLAKETMERLGLDHIGPDDLVEKLRPSEKRAVMIAMAVSRDCRLLILDEPTASLGVDEAQPLLSLVEELPKRGITVLYVSHRLDEIERLCDRVTVMRDGKSIGVLERGQFDARGLIEQMVEEMPDRPTRERRAVAQDVSVRVRGLIGSSLRGLDVDIHAGAVTGFTGLVGSGADELLEIIAGGIKPRAGAIEVNGKKVSFSTPADALRAGIGYLPGTRASSALTELSLRENVLASSFGKVSSFGILPPRRERSLAREYIAPFDLEERVESPLAELSGGNQQKVLVARLIAADVGVIIVNDPTAGVDVRARADLHELLRGFADAGKTVIVRCSEPEELLDLADEIYVLAGGRLASSFVAARVGLGQLLEASAHSGAEVEGSEPA
ncbi:MAG: sugar ABC transporter ATP-binding protein [Solirubrobacterales bacterium]